MVATQNFDNEMQNVVLNNGIEMPTLGLGVYQVTDAESCERCVHEAIQIGYRLIDTASAYYNEKAVGNAIKKSGINREELFITTKLWISDAGYEKTKRAFDESLQKLQLDYIDLYLIHQPVGDIDGSWKAMEELYHDKRIRAIGVSNFRPHHVTDLINRHNVVPAINQIETHPFCQRLDAQSFLQDNGIQIESWSPFAQGRNGILTNGLLKGIAAKYSKSVSQIILRWLIQRNIVAIPKSIHKQRMAENLNIFDFNLSSEDMESIKVLDEKKGLIYSY